MCLYAYFGERRLNLRNHKGRQGENECQRKLQSGVPLGESTNEDFE